MIRPKKGYPSSNRFTKPGDWRVETRDNKLLDAAYIVTFGERRELKENIDRIKHEAQCVFILSTLDLDASFFLIHPNIFVLTICKPWQAHTPSVYPPRMDAHFFEKGFDIAYKRNFAIAHARQKKFRHILLIDDDIVLRRGFGARATHFLRAGFAGYGTYSLYHPDKSVTDFWMHAESGAHPEVSISGNCIALDTSRKLPFFPLVYNEDWLFFQYFTEFEGGEIFGGESVVQLRPRQKDLRILKFQQFGEILVKCMFDEPKRKSVSIRNLLSMDMAHSAIQFHLHQLVDLKLDWEGKDVAIEATRACCPEDIVGYGEALLQAYCEHNPKESVYDEVF